TSFSWSQVSAWSEKPSTKAVRRPGRRAAGGGPLRGTRMPSSWRTCNAPSGVGSSSRTPRAWSRRRTRRATVTASVSTSASVGREKGCRRSSASFTSSKTASGAEANGGSPPTVGAHCLRRGRSRRPDVLVQPEQVARVVLGLDRSQPREDLRVVSVCDPRIALVGYEVHVHPACAVRLHRLEEVLRPGQLGCIVRGALPPRLDYQGILA